ncbi:MAG: AraC family transcriptional regulator ligand-binding domain-containing protein [Mucilaginibacter sp.]
MAYAAQRDISPATLCELSNITDKELQQKDKALTIKQVSDAWTNAIHLSKDDFFGLHFGESLQLSALGIVGEIIKSSGTVGEAISIASSLVHLITDVFILEITQQAETFAVNFIPQLPNWQNVVTARQTLDLLMVFVVHEMDGLMLKKIKPQKVSYMPQATSNAELERVMRCPVATSAQENNILFDKTLWDEPIITANYEIQKLLLQQIPVINKFGNEPDALNKRIYNYLMNNSYLGMVSLDDIASNFNLSTRTIQRKLKDEQVSFQQINDEVRKSLAINYLKAGDVPVKQISYLLGYNELSAFTRTFKRWMGTTPGAYAKGLKN